MHHADFQGTLGSFMAYSQIGGSPVPVSQGPNGQPPGSSGGQGYRPEAPANSGARPSFGGEGLAPRIHAGTDLQQGQSGMRGNANTNTA
ncbi:hypothetical protein C1930_11990 [Stenotrophomonas sp. SAU14A_NAIMI4_8]|nr:hypothetical protein C1930_11990 [Stenotrophomonas sp. SAU14A_NAIMI4_8]